MNLIDFLAKPTRAKIWTAVIGCILATCLILFGVISPMQKKVDDLLDVLMLIAIVYGNASLVLLYLAGWKHLLQTKGKSVAWYATWSGVFLLTLTYGTIVYVFANVMPQLESKA
jgi:hypothetical protein